MRPVDWVVDAVLRPVDAINDAVFTPIDLAVDWWNERWWNQNLRFSDLGVWVVPEYMPVRSEPPTSNDAMGPTGVTGVTGPTTGCFCGQDHEPYTPHLAVYPTADYMPPQYAGHRGIASRPYTELDAAEREAMAAEQANREAMYQARFERLRLAEERAALLLLDVLSPQQRETYEEYGWFEVVKQGRRFRVHYLNVSNIVEYNMVTGAPIRTWCIVPTGNDIPLSDVLVSQKLLLDTDPGMLNRIGNPGLYDFFRFQSMRHQRRAEVYRRELAEVRARFYVEERLRAHTTPVEDVWVARQINVDEGLGTSPFEEVD